MSRPDGAPLDGVTAASRGDADSTVRQHSQMAVELGSLVRTSAAGVRVGTDTEDSAGRERVYVVAKRIRKTATALALVSSREREIPRALKGIDGTGRATKN